MAANLADLPERPRGDSPRETLSWTAFQYVAGELDTADADAFEARLETDQAAREALAQAVELVGAVRVLASVSGVTRSDPSVSRGLWLRLPGRLAVAAAVALAATLGLFALSRIAETSTPDQSLVLAWSDLRLEETGDDPIVEDPSDDADLAHFDADLDPLDFGDATGTLPSWMVEAANLAVAEPPASERDSPGSGGL